MIKRISSCLILLIFSLPFVFSHPSASGKLILKFTGVRNDIGQMAIGMNRSSEGWPKKPHLEYKWKKMGIKNGVFIAEIRDLPFGTYAISVLDDENNNLEMDMVLGIPREGFGFSNNPVVRFKSPSFDDCAIRFNRSEMEVLIELQYKISP